VKADQIYEIVLDVLFKELPSLSEAELLCVIRNLSSVNNQKTNKHFILELAHCLLLKVSSAKSMLLFFQNLAFLERNYTLGRFYIEELNIFY